MLVARGGGGAGGGGGGGGGVRERVARGRWCFFRRGGLAEVTNDRFEIPEWRFEMVEGGVEVV